MVDFVEIVNFSIFEFIFEIIAFIALTYIGVFVFDKIKNSDKRYFDPLEFLPIDEIHTLKQVFYLIMMSLCFINVLYSLIFITTDYVVLAIFDIGLSLFIAITLDKSSLLNKILLVILVPFGSFTFLILGFSLVSIIDFIHVPVFLYFVKYYYDKFNFYTSIHGLSIAILLLFSIILFSFFLTQISEMKNPLDALVMVSNAFTSNGYAVLGKSIPGKINSIILVWGGYIISGAATASLTATILIKHFNKRVEKLERIINEGSDE